MPASLQIIVFGSRKQSVENLAVDCAVSQGPSVARKEATADQLNSTIADSQSEYILLHDAGSPVPNLGFVDALLSQAEPSVPVAGLLAADTFPYFQNAWNEFPDRISCLVSPPTLAGAFVIAKEAISNVGPMRDVADPIWDWTIRAVHQGYSVLTDPGSTQGGRGPLPHGLPALAPEYPDDDWLAAHLSGIATENLIPRYNSKPDAEAIRAGLFQIHDFLEESHTVAQSVQGQGRRSNGDYWHAIMHRREPDAGNSKYWFRRVGKHNVLELLAEPATAILGECDSPEASSWSTRIGAPHNFDPFVFVDMCEFARHEGDAPLSLAARQIQWAEMLLLLSICLDDAGS